MEAGRYDAGDLAEARTRLASADTAVSEKKMDLAARFADDAMAVATAIPTGCATAPKKPEGAAVARNKLI